MSSSQRLTAIGALCRRPTALLLPLTPLVLLAFVVILLVGTMRSSLSRRATASADSAPEAVPAAESSGAVDGRATRFQIRPRGVIAATAALFGGVLLAASMAGGTFAFLNAQKTTPAVSVSSGSLLVTVQAAGTSAGITTAIPTAAWATMLPGDVVGQTITVANSGSVPTAVTARLSALSAWEIRLAAGSCPTTLLPGAALSTSAVSYGTLAASSTAVVCVQASLPAGAAAGVENTSAPFTIMFDAQQVAS